MWLKKLFTIPEGEKITEKIFSRILVSSICSILVCMSCLFGMTWTWFTVDIVNQGNVIQIADVTLATEIQGQTAVGENMYKLAPGTYQLKVAVTNTSKEADAFDYKAPVYVRMTVKDEADKESYYYLPFGSGSGETTVTLVLHHAVTIEFEANWAAPGTDETEIAGEVTIGTAPPSSVNIDDTDSSDTDDSDQSNTDNAENTNSTPQTDNGASTENEAETSTDNVTDISGTENTGTPETDNTNISS